MCGLRDKYESMGKVFVNQWAFWLMAVLHAVNPQHSPTKKLPHHYMRC
jgi:hypothetical protein